MDPQEEKRTYCVYGYWHLARVNQYVMKKDGKIELHLYDNIDDAVAFIKEHSLWNVNITWSLTWDKYEIERLQNLM